MAGEVGRDGKGKGEEGMGGEEGWGGGKRKCGFGGVRARGGGGEEGGLRNLICESVPNCIPFGLQSISASTLSSSGSDRAQGLHRILHRQQR